MKKRILITVIACLLAPLARGAEDGSFGQFWSDMQKPKRAAKSAAGQRRMDWWRDARFGMFIHWNMSSVAAAEISWSKEFHDGIGEDLRTNPRPSAGPGAGKMAVEVNDWSHEWMRPPVPGNVYDNLHHSFYPAEFDAPRIVAQAKAAGMKYIVQVAKHHDGFCMWDSKFTDYDIMATPFRRDIVAEMAKACGQASMKYGIYYSQRDWHHPDYGPERMAQYNRYMRDQIRELLESHPNISVVWFDAGGYPAALWESKELFQMIHSLRPDVIINNRCGLPGDYATPEQKLGSFDLAHDWESCMTFTGFWSWHGFQTSVISYEECLSHLVRCAGGNGNLLMNVGPMPTGQIDPREEDRLLRVGVWLEKTGESIYGTRGGPYKPGKFGVSTRKDRAVYLHILQWPDGDLVLPALPAKVLRASVLGGGPASASQNSGELRITVAPEYRQPAVTVVKLEIDKPALEIPPAAR